MIRVCFLGAALFSFLIGREAVDSKRVCKKTPQVRHYLMRNALYIAYGCPASWKNELEFIVKDLDFKIVADASFIKDNRYYIIEIDCHQKMINNRKKIEKYKKLISMNVFEHKPVFIWMTTTEFRKKQLLKLCEGLQVFVYLERDFI